MISTTNTHHDMDRRPARRLKLRNPAKLWKHEGAAALIEFGLMLPVLMTLFYASIEITRFILISQKVEKLAHSVADVTAQSQTASLASLNQVSDAASDIMSPFSLATNGKIFVSSLYRTEGAANATVNWRYECTTCTLPAVASQLGAVGATPTMPAGFTFDERENVIAGEVYFRFTPLISSQFFGTTTVYRAAFYKPRLGALLTPPA